MQRGVTCGRAWGSRIIGVACAASNHHNKPHLLEQTLVCSFKAVDDSLPRLLASPLYPAITPLAQSILLQRPCPSLCCSHLDPLRRHATRRVRAIPPSTSSCSATCVDRPAAEVSSSPTRLCAIWATDLRWESLPTAGWYCWKRLWRIWAVHERPSVAGSCAIWTDGYQARPRVHGQERTCCSVFSVLVLGC